MKLVSFCMDGHVARIILQNPETRNSLDPEACRELVDALVRAEDSPSAASILLEAQGPAFSVGLEIGQSLLAATTEDATGLEKLLNFGPACRKPLVAAVHGAALGAAAVLVAGAHFALAAQGTSFGFTDIRVGLWPFPGWNAIQRSLGPRRALALSLTGRIFSAQEALSWGLIDEITQPSELGDRAYSIASLLAAAPPAAVRAAIEWSRQPGDAAAAWLQALSSAEAREGVTAHIEKRRPDWPGCG